MSTPISMPSFPSIKAFRWMLESKVDHQESEFTFHSKSISWPGKIRRAQIKLKTFREPSEVKEWIAFFLKLNGTEKRFYLSDPKYADPRGLSADAYVGGLVKGDDQTGQTLATDGWPNSITNLFLPGDWISVRDRLYSITAAASSNGSGEASLAVWPEIESIVEDNDVILVGTAARGVFQLESWPDFGWDEEHLASDIVLTARESFAR